MDEKYLSELWNWTNSQDPTFKDRYTFDSWSKKLKSNEDYKKQCTEIDNMTLDFAESQLHKQIAEGNTSATIFFLKTKGKKRGYVERMEVDNGEDNNSFRVEVIE